MMVWLVPFSLIIPSSERMFLTVISSRESFQVEERKATEPTSPLRLLLKQTPMVIFPMLTIPSLVMTVAFMKILSPWK